MWIFQWWSNPTRSVEVGGHDGQKVGESSHDVVVGVAFFLLPEIEVFKACEFGSFVVNMLVNQGLLPTPAIKALIFLEFPHRIHGTEIFTYTYHTFKPNVGRYTYHSSGSYEIYLGPKSWKNLCNSAFSPPKNRLLAPRNVLIPAVRSGVDCLTCCPGSPEFGWKSR